MEVDIVGLFLFFDTHLVGGIFFAPAKAAPSVIVLRKGMCCVLLWDIANLHLGQSFDMEVVATLVGDDKNY